MINGNELDKWILVELSDRPLTIGYIVEGWLNVVSVDAEVVTREALERLRRDGKIKSNPDGTWKLVTRPKVVAEVPGDPNFRKR